MRFQYLFSFLILLASSLYAQEAIEYGEVLPFKENLAMNSPKESPQPDMEVVGRRTATNAIQQMEQTSENKSDAEGDISDENEITDSEPEEIIEDQETITTVDSTQLPDTLFIDMTKSYMPTENRRMTSPFGMRTYRIHKGIDIKVQVGDTIRAAFAGVVSKVRYERRGYGKYVMIEHVDCGITKTVYGHLSRQIVAEGDTVQAGDIIGLGGNTGRSTGSHLHFETRINGMPMDPAIFFNFENQTFTKAIYPLSMQQAKADYTALEKVASARRYHRVRPGDNLGKIARRSGISIEKICRLNGIKRTTMLRIGRMLRCS